MRRPWTKKRILRIFAGVVIGGITGWSLAGLHAGATPARAGGDEPGTDRAQVSIKEQLAPTPEAYSVAGHLIAGITGIFFAAFVVGILTADNPREPMEEAARQDAGTDHH